ncbi:MAG TPA: PorV/PorQ family protein [Candidatus Cloacimonadota bacterium]|jgi:hypothetical protein|nr:PorV/PorQ family protein [Candidatus Cloacimonadales bacterium]HPY96234.1 PorV/PorQ family protein [Candidatus Cloacimonadota bacterium]HQB41928.1 PorV/PorQ family protein [Candidatus Cloacimonadota bacterium]
MLKKHTIITIITTIILLCPVLISAISEAGVIFLTIEPGSRPGGMGNAYVAQADDALANYWNPGALAFNRKTQIAGMHTNWFGDVDGINDMYFEYLAFNKYSEDLMGNFGFHVLYLTYGEQERITENNQYDGTFNSYEVAIAASYAYQYSENLGIGTTLKFILSDLSDEGTGQTEQNEKGRGMSYAFDIGIKKKNLLINKLDFGLNIQNIGPDISFINEEQADPLPITWRMGFSYRAVESEFNKLTINADMNKLLANDDSVLKRLITAWYDDPRKQEFQSTIFNVGGEYVYLNLLSIRGGYIYDKAGNIMGPHFGAGVQYTFSNQYKLSVDFAMQEGGDLTDYNKTFSIGLEF